MKPFTQTKMYKKGAVGERLIDDLIKKSNKYVCYEPTFDGAHAFDRLLVSPDKRKLLILEVKTLVARNAKPKWRKKGYPDTGISLAHYEQYKYIHKAYKIPVFVAFVDALYKRIYGNTLNKLDAETIVEHQDKTLTYPLVRNNFTAVGKRIIYFPLVNMRHIATLTDAQCLEIEDYSNYGYKQDVQYKSGYQAWKDSKNDL